MSELRPTAAIQPALETPLGQLVCGARTQGICLLEFTDGRPLEVTLASLRVRFQQPALPGESEHQRRLKAELDEYFRATRTTFTVPLVRVGSAFEMRVWDELLAIPYGELRSYQDVAIRIGQPHAARAVGRATGLNRMAIVIPCHRVVAKNGDVAGSGGGVWRKRLLLHLERSRSSL